MCYQESDDEDNLTAAASEDCCLCWQVKQKIKINKINKNKNNFKEINNRDNKQTGIY